MGFIEVKNRQGHNYKPRSSWLRYWMDVQGRGGDEVPFCARCNLKRATVGGHVYKAGKNETKEYYIVPLCDGCNNWANTDSFLVLKEDMVRAAEDD